jgi:hypothetical protein
LVAATAVAVLSLAAPAGRVALAQIPSDRGQNVVPVYEGWQRREDGSFDLWFGYYNRNYKEQVDVPLGEDNGFATGSADRGQPTHFDPRRAFYVFAVRVPADWGRRELVWTLTLRGRTEKAIATLEPVWEVDDELIAKNKGGATLRLDLIKNDRPPSVVVAPVPHITFPGRATLTATVTDDGLPPPPRGGVKQVANDDVSIEDSRPQLPRGLTITWKYYRGPGSVQFDPPGPTAVTSAPSVTAATFGAPGTYELRATASDGLLETHQNFTVSVAPGSQATASR